MVQQVSRMEYLDLIVLPKVRGIFDINARTKISLNTRPVTVQFFLIALTDGDHLSAGDLLRPVVVNHSHETNADNSNSYIAFPYFVIRNTPPCFCMSMIEAYTSVNTEGV